MMSRETATGFAGGAVAYSVQDILGESIDNAITWRADALKGFGAPSVMLKSSLGLISTGLGYYGTTGKGPLQSDMAQAVALGYGLPNLFDGVLTGIRESTRAPAVPDSRPTSQMVSAPRARAPAREPSQVSYPPRKHLIEII